MSNYAFFDVDQTIYPGYSMADFYHTPSVKKIVGSDFFQEEAIIGHLYKSGQITYAEAGRRAAKLCASSVKGLKLDIVEALANEFVKSNPVKSFVLPLFSLLQRSGYTIVLVSGSLNFIVRAIAQHTHADLYHATTPEVDEHSCYTGNISHQLDDVEKLKIIKNSYDLTHATLLGFGDSTGDIPMLSLTHHAFIINPHQAELNVLAQQNPNYHLVDEDSIQQEVMKII